MHSTRLITQSLRHAFAAYCLTQLFPSRHQPSAQAIPQCLFSSKSWALFDKDFFSCAGKRFKQLPSSLNQQFYGNNTKQTASTGFKTVLAGTAVASAAILCSYLKERSKRAELDHSLETIWPEILRQIESENIPTSNRAEAIRAWLNDPHHKNAIRSVTHLHLNHYQLTALPPEIGLFSRLQWLSLSGNKLTFLPPEISNLTELTLLDLSRNRFTSPPPEISHFTKLTHLDLSDNPLQHTAKATQEPSQLPASKLHYPPTFE